MRTLARHIPAVVAAALLALPAAAPAQTTETAPLGDYTQTTPTDTTETTPLGDYTQTTPTDTTGTTEPGAGAAGDSEEGGAAQAATPQAAAPQPAAAGEESLAFTGFEALAVGALGLALMGGAIVLQRRRRA